jgi:hypothetical protein
MLWYVQKAKTADGSAHDGDMGVIQEINFRLPQYYQAPRYEAVTSGEGINRPLPRTLYITY